MEKVLSCCCCFFFKLQEALYKGTWFRFGQILFNLARMFAEHHKKSFVSAFLRLLLITYLLNLESGKRSYSLGKSLE